MKAVGICAALFCCGLGVRAQAAEVLHYILAPGSTITPYEGASPIGPTEPLTGRFDWVLYDAPVTDTIIAFNAVALSFQSRSFLMQLNTTPANDVMSALHLDSHATVFDEVADLSGLGVPAGWVASLSPGGYTGPPKRPIVLDYPDVGICAVGGGTWVAKIHIVAVMEGMLNFAPSFTKGPDVTVLQNSGPQTVAHWATEIRAGPTNEASQTLTFMVATDNGGLFSTPPAVAPDGKLTFTPARDRSGVALVTVVLRDNGGTQNGGQDTSPPQTFTITVLSPCQAVQELALSVQQADLGHFNKRPLLASLEAACASFERGNGRVGVSQLQVFQTKVRVQLSRTHPALAELWISEAQKIINIFAGSPRPVKRVPSRIMAPS